MVTKTDYETFIKTNFANFIADIKIFNNWEYAAKYLKYFNDIQVSPDAFRQIVFNQISYSDACNFNNIYICALPRISKGSTLKYLLPAQKEIISSSVNTVKTINSEVTFLDPIFKALTFGLPANNEVVVDDSIYCKLRVLRSTSSRRASKSIIGDVIYAIEQFFDPSNFKIGQRLDYTLLTNQILLVDGVDGIQTYREDTGEVYNGLSMFMWNPNYPELDKTLIKSDISLREFEFLYFDNLDGLYSKIVIDEEPYLILG